MAARFSELVQFRVTPGLASALTEAAATRHTTTSEVIRQAVIRELAASGVAIPSSRREATR